MPVEYGSLPFPEAIDYLKGKVNMPTSTWTSIWEGQHARAFTVAGAMKDDLLVDMRNAIDKGIANGTGLDQFRKDFDDIVARHGWAYNGGRNWRTRVIYETNMRTAYQAGRYKQLQEIKSRRPYWQYDHSEFVTHPRPEHEAWDGLILKADDPWWDTHYPPNGWGCRCTVRALSQRDLARMDKDGPDEAPPLEMEEQTVGIRGPNPRTVQVPKGIDPGWGYNVGKATHGETLADDVFEQRKVALPSRKDRYVRAITKGYREAGRPAKVPLNQLPVPLGETTTSVEKAADMIRDALSTNTYTIAQMPVVIDPVRLAAHIDLKRSAYLPLLDDVLSKPFETWMNFEKDKVTGKYRVATRLVKGYELHRGRWVMVVTEVDKGQVIEVSFLVSSSQKTINQERQGVLIQSEDNEE